MAQWEFLLLYIFVPLLGMGLVSTIQGSDSDIKRNTRHTALWTALVHLFTTVGGMYILGQKTTSLLYDMTYQPWLPEFNVYYYLNLDSININFMAVTAILVTIALYLGKFIPDERQKLYYTLVLLLQTVLNTLFMAVDMMVFLASLEIVILTIFVLVNMVSIKQHRHSIMGFFALTQIGGALISFVFLAIYAETGLTELYGYHGIQLSDTLIIFGGISMTIAILLYTPVYPLHGWFVSMISKGRTGVSVLMLGIFPAIGLYIAVRFLPTLFAPIMPQIADILIPVLSVIALMYVWFTLSRRHSPRNVIVYLFMTQCLICLVAILTNHPIMMAGAIFTLLGNIVAYGGLMTIMVYILKHGGQTALDSIGGLLGGRTPYLFFGATVLVACVVYIPGSMNFIGLIAMLKGAFANPLSQTTWFILGTTAISLTISVGVWVTFYRRLVFGRRSPIAGTHNTHQIPDVQSGDRLFLLGIGVFILVIEFSPWLFLEPIITHLTPLP